MTIANTAGDYITSVSGAVGKGWGEVMRYLNVVFGKANDGLSNFLQITAQGKRFGPIFDTLLGCLIISFVYMTKIHGQTQDEHYFGVSVLASRAILFVSAFLIAILGSAQLIVFSSEIIPGVPGVQLFSDKYKDYTAALKHGLHAITIVTLSLLMTVAYEEHGTLTSDHMSENTTKLFLWIVTVTTFLARWMTELAHGDVARVSSKENFLENLKPGYDSKHDRGPAILISTCLLLYLYIHGESASAWAWLTNNLSVWLILAYIIVVALDRKNKEIVVGEYSGYVLTGLLTSATLVACGVRLGTEKDQESLFVVLGVCVLDALRVGYGKKQPDDDALPAGSSALYRLLHLLIGVYAFAYITKTEAGEHNAITPVLYAVALASSLVKVSSVTFLTEKMYPGGAENFFRALSSTGLLLSSAYLWSHPLNEAVNSSTAAVMFFVASVFARVLDSIQDYVLTDIDEASSGDVGYFSWLGKKSDLNSATRDNPRSWLVFFSLVGSLVFLSMIVNDIDMSSADDNLHDGLITSMFFIALHILVVVMSLMEGIIPGVSWGALSRSWFVRMAVSTIVLASLAVVAGKIGLGEASLGSEGNESRLLMSLVAYAFADVVGRGLM